MSKTAKWLIIIFGTVGIFFIILVASVVTFLLGSEEEEIAYNGGKGKIAVVEINDVIVSSTDIVQQIKKFRKSSSIDALVIRIESPGGGVSPSQEIYEELKKTRKVKPVVVSMGSVAASGGYYIALGASKIVANPGTITGSIGVISQFMNFKNLLGKIGVSNTTIKSGKFKDTGSPYREFTAEDKRYFQEMVDDVYDQFVSAVAEDRHMKTTEVYSLADGKVYTGRQAYTYGLIDTIGTFEDAVNIASRLANISSDPSIVKERKREKLSDMIFGSLLNEVQSVRKEFTSMQAVQYLFISPN